MLSFATEFPVGSDHTGAHFLNAAFRWVAESPHSSFEERSLNMSSGLIDADFRSANETIRVRVASSDLDDLVGFEHSNIDGGINWTTTAVYSKSALSNWVSVSTARETDHLATQLPPARKPVLVRTLLNSLSGGLDGLLPVRPIPFKPNEDDIELTSRLLLDDAGTRLPIVYISAPFSGSPRVDVNGLASDLNGMAHVVVEPSRAFSRQLQSMVYSENVYGGVVGVYWPESSGRQTYYLPREFRNSQDLKRNIIEDIRLALLNRRPLYRCSWTAIADAARAALYKRAKNSGSEEVQQYAAVFDQEIFARDVKVEAAEREINRLRSEVRALEARGGRARGLLEPGTEQDFFPSEIEDILLEALEQARPGLQAASRRLHVVEEILKANQVKGIAHDRRQRLKAALRDVKSLDKKAKDTLTELGFEIQEGGKHHKVVYQGDARYTFTLAKTGSDNRGGLNAVSDIGKRVF